MINAVNALSSAYFLTGKEDYAKKSAELLRVWFLNPDTKINPNLDYGQGIPGKSKGSAGGIIDTVQLIPMIDSVRMIEKSQSWT